jgi:hypothetical protein
MDCGRIGRDREHGRWASAWRPYVERIIGTCRYFPVVADKKRCAWCNSPMAERDLVCSACKRVDFLGAVKEDKILLGIVVSLSLLALAGLLVLASMG